MRLAIPVFIWSVAISCLNDDDAITYSVKDVSSRITGFDKTVAEPGTPLTINGSQMDKVVRVFFGSAVVQKKLFTEVTESSVTLPVPLTATIGENDIMVVFSGNECAYTSIVVAATPAISSFTPANAKPGDVVSVFGINLSASFATGVSVGSVPATIVSQSATRLVFTAPAGYTTNKITVSGPGGDAVSTANLVSCADIPNDPGCLTALNPDPGFELGSGNDFTNWEKWNGGSFLLATTEPGEYYSGVRALKVVRDGSLGNGEWRIQLANSLSTWEVGASYTVYIRAKASANGGSIRVSTNPSAMYTGNQNVTTEWQWLAFTFPSANVESTRIVLDLNGNETAVTTFFIDDVKLVKN